MAIELVDHFIHYHWIVHSHIVGITYWVCTVEPSVNVIIIYLKPQCSFIVISKSFDCDTSLLATKLPGIEADSIWLPAERLLPTPGAVTFTVILMILAPLVPNTNYPILRNNLAT